MLSLSSRAVIDLSHLLTFETGLSAGCVPPQPLKPAIALLAGTVHSPLLYFDVDPLAGAVPKYAFSAGIQVLLSHMILLRPE